MAIQAVAIEQVIPYVRNPRKNGAGLPQRGAQVFPCRFAGVNHRVMVRAKGDEVARVVRASFSAMEDVVHDHGEVKAAYSAAPVVSRERRLPAIAPRSCAATGVTNLHGPATIAARRRAIPDAATHAGRRRQSVDVTPRAHNRDAFELRMALAASLSSVAVPTRRRAERTIGEVWTHTDHYPAMLAGKGRGLLPPHSAIVAGYESVGGATA
jgi:hypothetical protein